jgi:hypothetical protein
VPVYVRNEPVVFRAEFGVGDKSLTAELLKEKLANEGLPNVEVTPRPDVENHYWITGIARFSDWVASNLCEKLRNILNFIAPSVWVIGRAPIPEVIPAPEPIKQRRLKTATT